MYYKNIYEAEVQYLQSPGYWIDKFAPKGNIIKSTMFPKNWDKQRILEEIAFAWGNKTQDTNPSYFFGKSTNGIRIKFIIRANKITTVHPINKSYDKI